ncbi:MAG: CoB--CoM heterodisulfide reductase subunit B [Euryarchaeota archaeon]|nr:CoB--CoM heterodisulfide reductase subunit B [Euryarchaeota archaeon]
MTDYAYFGGCTMPVRNLNYDISMRRVAGGLGVKLVDVPEFGCCGYPLGALDHHTMVLLSARNLCVAEEKGLCEIVTGCTGCAGTLSKVNKALKADRHKRDHINHELSKLGHEFKGKLRVRHFARMLYDDVGPEKVRSAVVKPLKGLNVAAHYGCHYLKPTEAFDEPEEVERPHTLDRLIEATGAAAMDYPGKLLCCGGDVLGVDETTALRMAREKFRNLKDANADAMTLVCPFCAVMYDAGQKSIEVKLQEKFTLPVLYYPQILGLALGMDEKALGIQLNRTKAKDFVDKVRKLQ